MVLNYIRGDKMKGRLNIYLSSDLEHWYREQAAKAGVSLSGMVAMALHFYREQRDAVRLLTDLVDNIKKPLAGD